jgi:hypothetical protein
MSFLLCKRKLEINGVTGSSFHGDAAIDDISFHRQTCQNKGTENVYYPRHYAVRTSKNTFKG